MKMQPVVKKMWEHGTTLKKWADANGFEPGYCRHVIAGRRKALYGVGKGAKIVRALKLDGFWVEPQEKKSA